MSSFTVWERRVLGALIASGILHITWVVYRASGVYAATFPIFLSVGGYILGEMRVLHHTRQSLDESKAALAEFEKEFTKVRAELELRRRGLWKEEDEPGG